MDYQKSLATTKYWVHTKKYSYKITPGETNLGDWKVLLFERRGKPKYINITAATHIKGFTENYIYICKFKYKLYKFLNNHIMIPTGIIEFFIL